MSDGLRDCVRYFEPRPSPGGLRPGQKPLTLKRTKETEQRQELEKKTLALLNDVASAAWSLKLPENRIYIISNTADLLWTVDEKRARTLYWEALNSINLIPSQPARNAGERVTKAERETNLRAYISTFRLRQGLLRRIARRDSQLALEMLRATRQVRPRLFGPQFPLPDDRDLEQEISTLIRRGMPEEIVRVAATANDDEREHLYRQAAIIASFRGPTESFRDFVSKEVNNEGEQRKLLDLLDNEEITLAAFRKQVDELKKLLPKIRRKEERARAMAEVALMLKEKGEDAEAATLLDEAATLIKTDLKSETQSNALLTLLCAYAVVDPPKAFALAERTVDQANSQISLLMLVDKVIKSGAVKKSEIVLEQGGIMSLDFIVFRYGKGVSALAKTDFNRTRALADRFERNELRVLARLLILKGLMGSAP